MCRLSISYFLLFLFLHISLYTFSQAPEYPYPVKYLIVHLEQKDLKMAYMDVPSNHPNGQSVILFHGKNFDGFYWKDVIPFLNEEGFRVIVPDQLGFGNSDKPNIHYSFHQMATNSRQLLDSLNISKVNVIGHSMGGMLAIRFALMFPDITSKLILENPIGLEDYKTFVPYIPIDSLNKKELSATYESYEKYQQSYYPGWKTEYEIYVQEQAKILTAPGFREAAWANALTYEMIYEQPVCYELKNIKVKTLLIIGTADRTIVGKDKVPPQLLSSHGQYQEMGKEVHELIKGSTLAEFPGVGHIPHIQDLISFKKYVIGFLK